MISIDVDIEDTKSAIRKVFLRRVVKITIGGSKTTYTTHSPTENYIKSSLVKIETKISLKGY